MDKAEYVALRERVESTCVMGNPTILHEYYSLMDRAEEKCSSQQRYELYRLIHKKQKEAEYNDMRYSQF